jgi:hypothetical protein
VVTQDTKTKSAASGMSLSLAAVVSAVFPIMMALL